MKTRLSILSLVLLTVALANILGAPQIGRGGAGPRGAGPVDATPGTVSVQPPPVIDPDMVLLTVSVTGQGNAAVRGLPRERFEILEDGVPQKLAYFWEDVRPLTVGFIFDDSERMNTNDKVYVLKEAAQSFLKEKDPADEYFIVRMASFADVSVSFTTDTKNLPVSYGASGETALYDAIYVGLSVIKEAANPRKVLVAITSGGDRCCSDNNKRTTEQILTAYALRQPVQIYSALVADTIADADSEMVHRDSILLSDLATMTGGRSYITQNSARSVEALMSEIARGLKTQYIVGFKSTNTAHNGKRRGVKVKVSAPESGPKLSVWTKAGYYASKSN